jgi:hypothetical protein
VRNRCIPAAIVGVAVMVAVFAVDFAYAQTRYESRLEGVSYGQMAEWDSIYGSGRFYGGLYRAPGYGPFRFRARDGYTPARRQCTQPLPQGSLW